MDVHIGFPLRKHAACFTGCRPKDLWGYDKTPYVPLHAYMTNLLESLSFQGVRRFISGGAQGFDQLAFWAVNAVGCRGRSRVENHVYVPFPAQPSRWSADGLFGRAEYALMLSRADGVKYVSPNPDPSDFHMAVAAMHARNHAMVADSDLVVALLVKGHNDDWAHAKGGTAETVRYAMAKRVPVLAITVDRAAGTISHGWLA